MIDAGERSFYPAKIGTDGKIENDLSVEDAVSAFLNDLAYCRPLANGTYLCVAEHQGHEVTIRQVPIIASGRPT